MAELVVTMAIEPLVSKLLDKASSYLLDQYNVMEGMEEQQKTLKRKLPAILDVITDAEERATVHRKVAYEANEVFDEFKYEALRREAKKKGHYKELGLDVIKLFPAHNRVAFRYKMGRKLCLILQAIEVLIAEMQVFGFKYQLQPPVSKECDTSPTDKDKAEIVGTVLCQANNEDLAVVAIVGIGGIGKTTLAHLIYNEPGIQKHFQLLLWVCVSDTFDVNSLAKSIVEASPKQNDDTDKPPLERLQKLVSGQRFLLWERLKDHLRHGGTGSSVLTTTRDKGVADIMGADTHLLSGLEDRFLREIIKVATFSSEKKSILS
ncbi:hypothetical protein VPH35_005714 [Triticum aestivum]